MVIRGGRVQSAALLAEFYGTSVVACIECTHGPQSDSWTIHGQCRHGGTTGFSPMLNGSIHGHLKQPHSLAAHFHCQCPSSPHVTRCNLMPSSKQAPELASRSIYANALDGWPRVGCGAGSRHNPTPTSRCYTLVVRAPRHRLSA